MRIVLVGCGWYGKTDLLNLMQAAPVDVVARCDFDRSTPHLLRRKRTLGGDG